MRDCHLPYRPGKAAATFLQVYGRGRLHGSRSEEHTSELQSQSNLVCRLLLEKKKHKEFTRYTLARVPCPRSPNVPIYVLRSGATASSVEDFVFFAKNLGSAALICVKTAGCVL